MADEKLVVNVYYKNVKRASGDLTVKDTSQTPRYNATVYDSYSGGNVINESKFRKPFYVRLSGTNVRYGHNFAISVDDVNVNISSPQQTFRAGLTELIFSVSPTFGANGQAKITIRDVSNNNEVIATAQVNVIAPSASLNTYYFDYYGNRVNTDTIPTNQPAFVDVTFNNAVVGEVYQINSDNGNIKLQANALVNSSNQTLTFPIIALDYSKSGNVKVQIRNGGASRIEFEKTINMPAGVNTNIRTARNIYNTDEIGVGTSTSGYVYPNTKFYPDKVAMASKVARLRHLSSSNSPGGNIINLTLDFLYPDNESGDVVSTKPPYIFIFFEERVIKLSRVAGELTNSTQSYTLIATNAGDVATFHKLMESGINNLKTLSFIY